MFFPDTTLFYAKPGFPPVLLSGSGKVASIYLFRISIRAYCNHDEQPVKPASSDGRPKRIFNRTFLFT
ncbi:MAG: hypothetical protein CR981_04800 [Proteobacteria bacterium]|nr:MAG: hypothetical protein CR981_04800 [Pseudomonadota bacterium]PIE65304.1 MAG: hypothetical protein CSA26_04340 [Desulfobacterales bacterium]